MSFFRQFRLIFWKNFILQKRKPCVTLFEILLPVLFAGLLVILREVIKTKDVTKTMVFPSFLVIPTLSFSLETFFLFAPNNPAVMKLMRGVSNISGATGIPFEDESALMTYFQNMSQESIGRGFFGGVVVDSDFPEDGSLPRQLSVRIRPTSNSDDRWETRLKYPFLTTNDPRTTQFDGGPPNYNSRWFLSMQASLVYSMIETLNGSVGNIDRYTDVLLNMMPYPPYHSDPFLLVLQTYFPLFLVLSFILNALQNTKNIVYEKERKLKESMKMMGLSNFAHWSAWFAKCFLYLLAATLLFTLLSMIPVGPLNISVLGHTDPSLFFVFLVIYAISVIAFCFAISTFFSKAITGAAAAGILFFLTYVPYFFLQMRYEYMTTAQKIAACILPNIAMAFGSNIIGLYEGTGEGALWSNFHRPATVDDNFSLLLVMIMLLVDIVILLLITWYVDAVFPGEFGVPQPWYFPVLKSYWCGAGSNAVDLEHEIDKEDQSEFFEKEPTGLVVGVKMKSLRKVFGSGDGKKVAVAGTNLNMYQGHITVLLGHNGAGKTTTMSMLTGFIPPTSGTALVNGFDIRADIAKVRRTLGLCPQHDVLFDSLTVKEHLLFFAKLKGHPGNSIKEEVNHILSIVGLQEKANAHASTLSGGQKRKLSVGIALVAGSKVIILDEPTSGMDPQARREMWTILQRFKEDRTILLTTHFMDEADILGDRIAIMADGVVKCCGTSLFLKNKYGSGYHLTLVKNDLCDSHGIQDLITSHIPTATVDCDVGAELTYILPTDESSKFEQLFTDVQNNMKNLGVTSFGVSVTTMEEVFLRVGEGATDDPELLSKPNDRALSTGASHNVSKAAERDGALDNGVANNVAPFKRHIYENEAFQEQFETPTGKIREIRMHTEPRGLLNFNQNLKKNVGMVLWVQQLRAAFVKKMLHTWRNRVITIVQLLLPIIFTIIALVVDKTSKIFAEDPPLTLDMSHFRLNYVQYASDSPSEKSDELEFLFNETLKGTRSVTSKVNLSEYGESMISYFAGLGKEVGVSVYNRKYIMGTTFDADNSLFMKLTGFFNGQLFHSVAISLTHILNTLLKFHTDPLSSIELINHPLPEMYDNNVKKTLTDNSFLGFIIAFCILFGMAFLSSSFVMFIIKERSSQSKHIQIVCGLRRFLFWLGNFTWDFVNYLIPCLCILVAFAAFKTEAYTEERLGYVFIALCLHGWAMLPFVYAFHFLFKTPASGMVALTVLSIITGLATLLAVIIMKLPTLGTEHIADVLDWIFSVLLPNYCLGQSFWGLFINNLYISVCEETNYKLVCLFDPQLPCCKGTCTPLCFPFEENYLAWDVPGIGRYLLFLGIQGLLYWALVFLVEYGFVRRVWYVIRPPEGFYSEPSPISEDSDVAEERERVNSSGIGELSRVESLVLHDVTKSYSGYVAVEKISVGIPQNECFGLLGVNGAGKTSTFKMLTGDEIISYGNARLNGHDIKTDVTSAQANLGYCPQFDALIDQLTGRETLTMFARLKGITEKRISTAIDELMKLLTLEQYADTLAGNYSGGNKRKLSTAISLIGDPPVIFLDEPTTGVDPAARRQLWNVLSEIRASGRTLVLTSHSMEECDALCTRIAIMVNGRFLCLGSPQHLKNKFGQGYSLIARIADSTNDLLLQDFLRFIEATFPDHEKVDSGNGYVNYHLKNPSIPLAFIFGTLERVKTQYNIEDYSVSQTTLQQVFVDFARKQVPPREDKSGFCKHVCCCCSS